MDAVGHSIEDCFTFKNNVLDLIESGYIQLKDGEGATITTNPLPNHDRRVNAIESGPEFPKKPINIKAWMKELHTHLKIAGYLEESSEQDAIMVANPRDQRFCEYHQKQTNHDIESCPQFEELIERLMARGIVAIGGVGKEVHTIGKKQVELTVNVPRSKTPDRKISFVINKRGQASTLPAKIVPKQPSLIVALPTPFPYQSDHAVPWRYGGTIERTHSQTTVAKATEEPVTNIVGSGGVTRSGRIYLPGQAKKSEKGKEIAVECPNKPNTNELETTDDEFLRIMKQSDYDVVDQLKKTPARISILSLILSSKAHRQVLQKVLDEAFVQPDVTPEKVANVMNIAKSVSSISFSEEEIIESSTNQAKALYITLKCQGFVVAKVLIDGGSALNVLPLTTLKQLSVEDSDIKDSDMVVRAFDGSRKEVIGAICLPLEIGPSLFMVEFQVMDVEPSYTMLLGRPWIHTARAIPSTLHQRVKFMNNGKIVTVKGEEEMIVSKPSSVPYIETDEHVTETAFQNFEIEQPERPKKNINAIITKILERNGFEPGKGLGAHLQGAAHPLNLPKNPDRQGLGYEPIPENPLKGQVSKKIEKRDIPHIKETFPAPSEVMNPRSILVVTNSIEEEQGAKVYVSRCNSGTALDNWELESIPDIITLE